MIRLIGRPSMGTQGRPVFSEEEVALFAVGCESVFHARITALFQAYGGIPNLRDGPRFYVADGALLSLWGGVLTLDGEFFDAPELLDFIKMNGCCTLVCGQGAAHRLGCQGKAVVSPVMRYQGGPCEMDSEVMVAPHLENVYALLREVFDNMKNTIFGDWYADISLKIRRGVAYIYGIYRGGELLSTAGVYYQDYRTAVIGSVATWKGQRGHGYARRLIRALISKIQAEGRTPYIICLNEHAYGIYESLGFAEADSFYEITT